MISKTTLAQWLIAISMAMKADCAPVIDAFDPTVGAPGDQVKIYGSGFASGNFTLTFGYPPGVLVTVGRIDSDSQLTVTVPNGITTGPIGIQQGAEIPFYTTSNFLAIGSGPYISGFVPNYGAVNDLVTIFGVHFTLPVQVLFSGVISASPSVNAAGTQISARVPAGATNGVITVSTLNGSSNSLASFTVVGPGPFITGFAPRAGAGGTEVQITGMHFTGATGVTFNGRPGVNLAANSDTLIQVQAPPGVTSGPLTVTTPLGSAITSSNFYGMPVITNVAPTVGRAGTNVWVAGTNFLDASGVFFNGILSTNFSVLNNSNLIAAVPAGATTGLIRVVTPANSAFSTSNFVINPTLSNFSPAFGPVGTPVTITGANLNAGTPSVSFNGVPSAVVTGVNFGQLTAQVPPGATTGPISVTTTNGTDTSTNLFFLPGSIAGFSPTNSVPGSRITISGQNLAGASQVSFNGSPAAFFSVSNNTTIGATVPVGLITGPISVTTPAGAFQSAGLFYGAPLITNISPTHGLPGSSVQVQGVNFLGGTVQFNGLNAAITSLNNTQILATVPAGASSGPITVRGPAGTNASVTPFILDYTSDLAVWITNSPNPVTVSSNLLFTMGIVNNGPSLAPNVIVTNFLPNSVTLAAATISGPWILTTNGNMLLATTTNFERGASATLLISVIPQAAGDIMDTISVAGENPDPALGNNLASVTTTVDPLALLFVQSQAHLIKISWPAALTNFLLQSSAGFGAGFPWLNVTNPASSAGGLRFIVETNAGETRFYRLKD